MSELKTYKKKMGIFWWTEKMSHIKFITRELTSLAVAFFAIELLLMLRAVIKGVEAYETFLTSLTSPFILIINTIAMMGLFMHSGTWFDLAPKAMVIKIGDKKLPDSMVTLGNYLGWVAISALVVWYLI